MHMYFSIEDRTKYHAPYLLFKIDLKFTFIFDNILK